MYDIADLQAKKMIVANIVNRVIVSRDYDVQIVIGKELQELLQNNIPAGISELISIVA